MQGKESKDARVDYKPNQTHSNLTFIILGLGA